MRNKRSVPRICAECGAEYLAWHSVPPDGPSYCGRPCFLASRLHATKACQCERCGRPFQALRMSAGRFCSRACWLALQHESRANVACVACGKRFYMKPSQQRRSASGPFCSRPCAYAQRGREAPAAVRFFASVDMEGPVPGHNPALGPCWEWTGLRNRAGYGVLGVSVRDGYPTGSRLATRFIMEALVGYLRRTDSICHRCDHPSCVNPSHLYVGDATINAHDASQRERLARGVRQGAAVLTDERVRVLRRLRAEGWSLQRLADLFGVAPQTVRAAARGDTWTHLNALIT